jgi:hypothetical protein
MSPATWRTRRALRSRSQRRRRPFELVAVICAHRAESALKASYTAAGPKARPGDPVRGEAARWVDCWRAHYERGVSAFWRAFHAEPDKGGWLCLWRENPLIWGVYVNPIQHMLIPVWPDLRVGRKRVAPSAPYQRPGQEKV